MILILENAINYNSMEEAKEMIRKGKELTEKTGVQTLSKFQLFGKEQITNPEHVEYCMKRALSFENAKMSFEYGKEIGQEVFFTCMAPEYVEWCEEIGVRYYKIRYFDRLRMDIIYRIPKNKTMFVSTDNALIHTLENTINLFCIPEYPAPKRQYVNEITSEYPKYKGISDHTPDLYILKNTLKYNYLEYFERHVCLTKEGCLEAEWASEFSEIEKVLRGFKNDKIS